MKIAIFIIAALVSYFIAAVNPAILLSKLIYKKTAFDGVTIALAVSKKD